MSLQPPPLLLETRLGRLLGGGTWLACAVIAVGLGARLLRHESAGDHIMTVGVGLIIALPALRLITMLAYFYHQGERKLAAISGLVLIIVALGALLGLVTHG
jgi:uncharacterized membrane protein